MKLTMEQYGYQAYFQNETRIQINEKGMRFSDNNLTQIPHFENSFLEHHEYHPKNLRKKCREICESGLVSIL